MSQQDRQHDRVNTLASSLMTLVLLALEIEADLALCHCNSLQIVTLLGKADSEGQIGF